MRLRRPGPLIGQRFFHLLNCSPSHLLYFFARGEKIGATRFELATSRSRTVRVYPS